MPRTPAPRRLWSRWNSLPLYIQILLAMLAAIPVGMTFGAKAVVLEVVSRTVLQLLGALAPPLILVAVTHVLMTTKINGAKSFRLIGLLLLNTVVAIGIGLAVANTLEPGTNATMTPPEPPSARGDHPRPKNPVDIIVENIPKSFLGPLGDRQNIIGVIFIAVALGVALRSERDKPIASVLDFVDVAYAVLVRMLHWVIHIVPLGVFAIVAKTIGTQGFEPFKALAAFVAAVLVALALQACWYLARIWFFSWVHPIDALRGTRDALVMAFSTASSTATMPVTYTCLKENVGIREESASLGSLVGANFNNDGTALYEAMSALFVAQLLGQNLSLDKQLLVVLTSIVASVGAAGIPEAGLVTMTLVFTAVGLPVEYIALLLTVDWFLDRCRTTINVLGDINVSCLLDGTTKPLT